MTAAARSLVYLVVVVVVIAAWQLLTATGAVGPLFLAAPADVVIALRQLLADPGTVFGPIGVTLLETMVAVVIAFVVAVSLGVLVGSIPTLRRAYEPLFTTANAVPLVILYPVLAAMLGVGSASKIAMGTLYAFFPVVIATVRSAGLVDKRLLTAARTMGASRRELLSTVVVPAIASPVVASVRVAVSLALVTIIASEFISGAAGVGYQLGTASQALDSPALFAWVVIACALTIVVNILLTASSAAVQKGINR